jgi:deoxyribodipyrimidine photolyase-related protein
LFDCTLIMRHIAIIFPHQLFQQHPALQPKCLVYVTEEHLFFKQYAFHQQKILLHRASMKCYAAELTAKGHEVKYIDAASETADCRLLLQHISNQNKNCTIHIADVADDWLYRRLHTQAGKLGIAITWHTTPNFLNTPKDGDDFFGNKKNYFQTAFYTAERKKRNLLLEKDGSPAGGQWTFDADNRERYPKNKQPPALPVLQHNAFVEEAIAYVKQNFAHHYGNTAGFNYPTTRQQALAWLDDFLQHRFAQFGIYEDAIVAQQSFLHHSVLTPLLNIGLINPQEIIDRALQAANRYQVPINSLEGFVRQITGWREFIRLVYQREGRRQRTKNYWGFTRKIPATFWQGNTGIFPVDNVIKKTLQKGYSHHIERLMVMGNFMLLCEFDPNEVYKWFMEMYIDAYDWVMVPNVYGMTQFADGGLMTTKPYISGSNYLLKMSDYPKGDWCSIWDALFWRFMHVHRSFFLQNPRLGMLIKTFDKMPAEKQNLHLTTAEKYLASLH